MSILKDSNQTVRDRLVYDPVVKGFSNLFWATTSGAPTASGGDLRLNAAAIASFSQYVYGDFEFQVNIATTPSAGEAKHWGLRNPASSRGAMYFEITGATFQAVSVSDDGNTTNTTAVTWNDKGKTYNGNMTKFRIVWTKESVKFYVDTIEAAVAEHITSAGSLPLALRLSNTDADNMDVDFIIGQSIGKIVA